jgi:hypothetical protein
MRQPGSLRPTEQGLALAKDTWILGMGLGLIIEEFNQADALAGQVRPPRRSAGWRTSAERR